ncbi:MAG: hypothetical protein HRT69_15545 [Flavobacteriaceae bacterium]|nr:hypothetical protein [Flavobacteriaceae bacterium]
MERILTENRRLDLLIGNNTGINYNAQILHMYNGSYSTTSHILSGVHDVELPIFDEIFPYTISIKYLKAQAYGYEKKYLQPFVPSGYLRKLKFDSPVDIIQLTTEFSDPIYEETSATCVITQELFNKYAHTGVIKLTLSVEKGEYVILGCE